MRVFSEFNKDKHTISKLRLFIMKLRFWKYKEIITGVILQTNNNTTKG